MSLEIRRQRLRRSLKLRQKAQSLCDVPVPASRADHGHHIHDLSAKMSGNTLLSGASLPRQTLIALLLLQLQTSELAASGFLHSWHGPR